MACCCWAGRITFCGRGGQLSARIEVRREPLDDGGWASLGKPWEELVRDDALMGVFDKAVGGAARVEALVAGQRCLAALKYS